MSTDETETLQGLMQRERAAIRAYEAAIEACDATDVRAKLSEFSAGHVRRLLELEAFARAWGAPVEPNDDMPALVADALDEAGDRTALMTMRGNERLTSRCYASASLVDLPDELRRVVVQAGVDEERYLDWIEAALRAWERRSRLA